MQRGRALVERLDEDVEARRVRGDEAGEVGDQHDRREVLHVGHLVGARARAWARARGRGRARGRVRGRARVSARRSPRECAAASAGGR